MTSQGLRKHGIHFRCLIFVVEDDLDVARLIQYHLEREGYVVRHFADTGRAIREALKCAPSLILIDPMVAVGEGARFSAELQRFGELSQAPMVLLRTVPRPADAFDVCWPNVKGHLPMPFTRNVLIDRVRQIMDGPARHRAA